MHSAQARKGSIAAGPLWWHCTDAGGQGRDLQPVDRGGNAPEPTGERGVIVDTGSVAAHDGQIGLVAYPAPAS